MVEDIQMTAEEVWKDIPGYEGLYQAGDLGNIKSLNFNNSGNSEVLKQGTDGRGYLIVKLYKKGIPKTIKVHILIAMVFHNHVPNGHKSVVNHKNLIKTDNRAVNFEITTNRENCNKKHIPSSSVFVGVYWNKQCKKWQSSIEVNGKKKYLGLFDSEIEASECYKSALKAHNSGEKITVVKKKFKGCYFNKNRNKWHSRIEINGKKFHIGYFSSESEAIEAYQNRLKLIV